MKKLLILLTILLLCSQMAYAAGRPSTIGDVYHKGPSGHDVRAYGAVGDGATDDRDVINDAHTAATAAGGVIIFPVTSGGGTYKISSDITFNSDVTLLFLPGAKLSVDSGDTVTINGKVAYTLHQIFSGAGTTTFAAGSVTEVYPHWWGITGDGVTDDSAALTSALEACMAINDAGRIPTLRLAGSVMRISYTKNQADADPFVDRELKAYYLFDPWSPNSDVEGGASTDRQLIVEGEGAILLCDGDANSWFWACSNSMTFVIRNVTFRAYDLVTVRHGLSLAMLYSICENISFQNFYEGIGFNIFKAERNAFINVSFNDCQRGLVMGNDKVIARDNIQCNENRFYNTIFNHCGYSLSHPETLDNGFLEIHYAENTAFYGGSWKTNKNGVLLRAGDAILFSSIYFEYNGVRVGNVVFPGEGALATHGYRNHVIIDPPSSSITNLVDVPVYNITFQNCFIGSWSGITIRAEAGVMVKGLKFDNCRWGLTTAFNYVIGEEAFIRYISLNGVRFDALNRAVEATTPIQQQAITYPGGEGVQSFTALDITYTTPSFNHNRWATDKALSISRDLHIIDGNGLVIGHTSQLSVGEDTAEFQILGTTGADASMAMGRWSNNASAPTFRLYKSRNATIGSHTAIISGDNLALLSAYGDDGTDDDTKSSEIRFVTEGTIGTGRVPGVIVLSTAKDSGDFALEEAMRITSAQNIRIAGDLVADTYNYAPDTTSDDDYLIALEPAPAAYVEGMEIKFKAVTANTGACTVKVNALAVISLKMLTDQDPPDSYIEAGTMVWAIYDGATFQMFNTDANP